MATNSELHTVHYKAAFSRWPKASGEKPTDAQLGVIHAMNIRPGKHALACAMYLRDSGATDEQVRAVAAKLDTKGGIQQSLFNYMHRLVKEGFMRRDMDQPKGVYKITLTKRGEAQVNRAAKQADPTPKAKRAKKPTVAEPVAPVAPQAEVAEQISA